MPMDSLNFDVVETILSYVGPQDALKLATTCRSLHTLAVQRLLSHISIDYNWSIDRILQYCTYMLADAEDRPRCLRSFSIITIPRGDLSVFDTLAEVLGHAPSLRRVSLSWEAGYALDDSPAFADALASLDSLDLLDICGVHLGLMRLLPRMKCRPRTVHCDLFPVSDSDYLEMSGLCKAERSSPLCNFANCVTSLKLGHAAMLIEELVHTVWPCVRELSVSSSTIKGIQSISYAFPNLRTIRFWNVRLKDPAIPAEWRQLQFVSTTDPIPLQCHVHHVQLNVDCERASMSYIHQSFEMLRCASPVTLGCYASVGLFRHVAEHLRSLRILHFDASNVPLDIPMHPTIISLATALKAVPLVALTVDIPIGRTSVHDASYAEVLAATIPSLELVGVNHYDPTENPHWAVADVADGDFSDRAWYHVSRRTDDIPVLEALPRWAGFRAHERMMAASVRSR